MKNDPNWVGDEAIAMLNLERAVHGNEDHETLARRIFRETAPLAAQRIAHIAIHSTNETAALSAARYISDRVLGKIGEDQTGTIDPLEAFIQDISRQAEAHANSGEAE